MPDVDPGTPDCLACLMRVGVAGSTSTPSSASALPAADLPAHLADEGRDPLADEGRDPFADVGRDPFADEGRDPLSDVGRDPFADMGREPFAEDLADDDRDPFADVGLDPFSEDFADECGDSDRLSDRFAEDGLEPEGIALAGAALSSGLTCAFPSGETEMLRE